MMRNACPVIAWLDACVELDACRALVTLGIEHEYGPRHRFALIGIFFARQRYDRETTK